MYRGQEDDKEKSGESKANKRKKWRTQREEWEYKYNKRNEKIKMETQG